MVPKFTANANRYTYTTTYVKQNTSGNRAKNRTFKEQALEGICLESIWKNRLHCLGWSNRSAIQTVHSLAKSTLETYNHYVNRYITFCIDNNCDFSSENNYTILADFFCVLADSSDRPESVLKVSSAAITCLFEGLGKTPPTFNTDIKRLITGLIKTGTTRPMHRSKPMPVQNFVKLFRSWGKNELLSVKRLRLKAMTLLALICMTRPSDLAPRGLLFNSQDLSFERTCMTLNDLEFHEDGSLTITFFAIKNDRTRTGFEVRIPQNHEDEFTDPVSCLKTYISKTEQYRLGEEKPLFLSLNHPYQAITVDTVRHVLEEVIVLAGLSNQGFSAKSFRPTGATVSVTTGISPETAMQIGRWKTMETFLNHYVYPKVPADFTTNVFSA